MRTRRSTIATRTELSAETEPMAAVPTPDAARLVKVNSAQINQLRQRYQQSGKAGARAGSTGDRRERATARVDGARPKAGTTSQSARGKRDAERRFRQLALELGLVRAKALVAEVEQRLAASASR